VHKYTTELIKDQYFSKLVPRIPLQLNKNLYKKARQALKESKVVGIARPNNSEDLTQFVQKYYLDWTREGMVIVKLGLVWETLLQVSKAQAVSLSRVPETLAISKKSIRGSQPL